MSRSGALARPSGLPTWGSAGQNTFDPRTSAYNWHGSNTRRSRAGYGRAAAGTGKLTIGCVNDSGGIGYNGSTPTLRERASIPGAVATALARTLGSKRAGGFLPAVGQGNGLYDAYATSTGSGGAVDISHTYVLLTGPASITYTAPAAGQTLYAVYFGNSGTFTWAVDGGATTSVTGDGSLACRGFTAAGLADAVHTLTLSVAAGQSLILQGCGFARTDTGVVAHQLGCGGTGVTPPLGSTLNYADQSNSVGISVVRAQSLALTPDATPDVILASFGGNDAAFGATPAQYVAGMTALRAQYPNSDFVMYGAWRPPAVASEAAFTPFWNARYQIADALGCPLVDLQDRCGNQAAAVAGGFAGADGIHPTWETETAWGALLAELIAS